MNLHPFVNNNPLSLHYDVYTLMTLVTKQTVSLSVVPQLSNPTADLKSALPDRDD